MDDLKNVIKQYDVGYIIDCQSLAGGIIHKTWKVQTSLGTFVLQKVNSIYSPVVMEDLDAVLGHLKKKGYKVAEIIRTKDGKLCVNTESGFWRMFEYADGEVHEEVPNSAIAYQAGLALGKYHKALSDLVYDFKHIRGLKNNIPLLFSAYKSATEGNSHPEIESLLPKIDKMIEINLPSGLRKTRNHGDPKISNYIFDKNKGEVITMIDFDDCGENYNVLYELGSAFRSWSWNTKSKNGPFDLDYFSKGLEGYLQGSGDFLTVDEKKLLLQAIKLNLLQLSSRFVRDFFEDSYFEWDESKYSSRREHNLARANEHIAFYEDICKKELQIKEIISKFAKEVS